MAAVAPTAAAAAAASTSTADADVISSPQKVPARSQPRGKRERPCDGCRRRKGRCVPVEGQNRCTACAIHNQPCTFVEDPKPRKRKTENGATAIPTHAKKKSHSFPAHGITPILASQPTSQDESVESRPTGSIQNIPSAITAPFEHHSYIGLTTEHEPSLIRTSSRLADSGIGSVRDYGRAAFFVKTPNTVTTSNMVSAVQAILKPHLSGMAETYRQTVHESFPILDELVITQLYAGNMAACDTLVAAAMFLAVLPWYERNEERQNLPRLDRSTLEGFVFGLFTQSLYHPSLHTVQAGLLLMQCSGVDTKVLNAQVSEISYELGLNLDCASWTISPAERALRRRLAWAVFMQDRWSALVHGRPSNIPDTDWVVPPLSEGDFPSQITLSQQAKNPNTAEDGGNASSRRCALFIRVVQLTRILAEVITSFHSVSAQHDMEGRGPAGLRYILERVKHVQITLKEWFNSLPLSSRMESRARFGPINQQEAGAEGGGKSEGAAGVGGNTTSTGAAASNAHSSTIGFLHLAYYATEITLHRAIIRAQPSDPLAEPALVAIVRTAAKERLISALEFANRLRAPALAGFWHFPARVAFAVIGTFGALLAATAPALEEHDFYVARLKEYRWTLGVAIRHAPWLAHAAAHLDANMTLLAGIADKPTASELADAREKSERKEAKARRKSAGVRSGATGAPKPDAGVVAAYHTTAMEIDEEVIVDEDDEDDEEEGDDHEDEYDEDMNDEELEEIERELEAEDRARALRAVRSA